MRPTIKNGILKPFNRNTYASNGTNKVRNFQKEFLIESLIVFGVPMFWWLQSWANASRIGAITAGILRNSLRWTPVPEDRAVRRYVQTSSD